MLTPITEAEFDRYAPWAYNLAMTAEHSSYPTYRDGIKTREEFMARSKRDDEEVLLFRHEGEVRGWIQWYAIAEENYAMTVSFLVENHAEAAAAEFAEHVAALYPGVTLDIGMDAENAQVCLALEKCGFTLLESSVNHTIFFDRDLPQHPSANVSLMTAADEADFRRLHNHTDMYWNADRILADGPHWKVYLYRRDHRPEGALCCRIMDDWPEVFSIDWEGGAFQPEIYRDLMAVCLRDVKDAGCAHMTYFEEEEQALPILAALGFTRVGHYLGYRKVLKGE